MPKKRYEEFFSSKEEALKALSPQDIGWYEGTREGMEYGYKCFYCGATPVVGYRVEQLTNGQLIGKPVCERHRMIV